MTLLMLATNMMTVLEILHIKLVTYLFNFIKIKKLK